MGESGREGIEPSDGPQHSDDKVFNVGTRNSKLALVQTEMVVEQLVRLHKEWSFKINSMATTGDKVLDVALSKIGTKALFTKELELALVAKTADFVVHSLKDMPTTLPKGMVLAATLEREDPRDSVVFSDEVKRTKPHVKTLADLPEGAVVGTSSVRRSAQMRRKFPHLLFRDVRGNVQTRLAKLNHLPDPTDPTLPFSAILLAHSGLIRLHLQHIVSYTLDEDESLYAVGQGALAVECRHPDGGASVDDILQVAGEVEAKFGAVVQSNGETSDVKDFDADASAAPTFPSKRDAHLLALIRTLEHRPTRVRVECERQVMRRLEGGCSVPLGVRTEIVESSLPNVSTDVDTKVPNDSNGTHTGIPPRRVLHMTAAVWTLDGSTETRVSDSEALATLPSSPSSSDATYPDAAFDLDLEAAHRLAERVVAALENAGARAILDEIKGKRERGEVVLEDVSKRPKKKTAG
ncbi:hypothetical protein M427DRAFT_141950 [Gonapodya prolifera JEL478]|uniref:hydroxymethylbilane synthase n=1 Tax=Gonapodya prolifera (strain JEL478) TaxID=1344416 RepID=A0A139B160_GONPJ|nr:hypothetical protein M427DRAFT_141950 [Gonapodya prolifera JEL478]|eukprot:KXS22533.1 hypothetical protein M427DRAFT_141950 [Gonapodya prolifera JEL478]